MDCDDATLLVAEAEARTLSGSEAASLHRHADNCEECRALLAEREERYRWIVRIPEDALDDPDLLVLPVVDPSVFIAGDELARGGMGRVIKARDRRLARDVAIKEVVGAGMRARFEREVAITAKLQHPAIIPVYEAGAWPSGTAFYTMRLVSGGTLGEAIARTQTLEQRIALLPHVVALTDALGYAHAQHIVHRDLKPANVLVGKFGETVVIDWGLAKELGCDADEPALPGKQSSLAPLTSARAERAERSSMSPSADLTIAGSVMGTPGFMSPEQADGTEVDARSDVYALGAILYNVLSGQTPYHDEGIRSAHALIAAAKERGPTPIAKLVPRAPADLCAIVDRAMARPATARYPDAGAMAEELHRFEAGQLLQSRGYSTRELIARWLRRHRAAVAVAAVAVVVVAVGGIASVRAILRNRDDALRALAIAELEQGRQLVVAGDPARATPFLAAAVEALPADADARELEALALRDADRRLAALPGTAAAFSVDGRVLAVGRSDGAVDLVDAATGRITGALAAAGDSVARVDFAPAGDAVVTASRSGAFLRELSGTVVQLSRATTSDARFVSDDRIAIATPRAVAIVARDGTLLASDDLDGVKLLDMAPDRSELLAVGSDDTVAWRLPELARIAKLTSPWYARLDGSNGLVIGDGDAISRVAFAAPETKVVLDAGRNDQPIWRLPGGALASANRVWDPHTGRVQTYTTELTPVAIAGLDATHIITGGYDRMLRIWDLARPTRPIVELDADAGTEQLVATPDGTRVVSVPARGDIELWKTNDLIEPTTVGHLDGAWRIVYAEGALAVGFNWQVEILDASFRPVATVHGWLVEAHPGEVIVNDDGRYTIYDGRTGAVRGTLSGGGHVDAAAVSPSGDVIATAASAHVELRNARSGAVTAAFDTGTVRVTMMVLDDVGHVAVGHDDGSLQIWDAATGTLRATLGGHQGRVELLVVRGDRLLSGSWDGSLRAWSWPGGESQSVLLSSVGELAVSPAGRRIVTAEQTAVVDVWDGERGLLLRRIPTVEKIKSLAFVDDDLVLAVGAGGIIERIDLSVRLRDDADIARLAAASRWQLVDGRAVERLP